MRTAFRILIISAILLTMGQLSVMACHRGGPMGFADEDPGMFSMDITFSPTFIFASTFGTSGCRNWDMTHAERHNYITNQWMALSEEAAKGSGQNLKVLSRLIGCSEPQDKALYSLIQQNYFLLFVESDSLPYYERSTNFLEKLSQLIRQEKSLSCSLSTA